MHRGTTLQFTKEIPDDLLFDCFFLFMSLRELSKFKRISSTFYAEVCDHIVKANKITLYITSKDFAVPVG